MLFKTLDILRTKPKVIRDQFAFMAAIIFTLVVAGIWALSIPSRLARITDGKQATTTAPFAGLFTQFKAQFSDDVVVSTTAESVPISSVASMTAAALNLDLSSTTKTAVESSGTIIRFASTTIGSASATARTAVIATSSASTTR